MIEAVQGMSPFWWVVIGIAVLILYKNGYLDGLKPKVPPATPRPPVIPPAPVPAPVPIPPGPNTPAAPVSSDFTPVPVQHEKVLTAAKLAEWCQANGITLKS